MQTYIDFLKNFDKKLDDYNLSQANFMCCKKGCSGCCEQGDYPISELELKYLMQGFVSLSDDTKKIVQENFKNIVKGGKCPFLINSECSVYNYRPIICRVHGLAYLCKDGVAKVPYCVYSGLNYSKVFKKNELLTEPIQDCLDTKDVLNDFNYGEIRNLCDWLDG